MYDLGYKCILLADEGNEKEMSKLLRKMCVYNPIKSRFKTWIGTSDAYKNIPLDNILEDIIFKSSSQSFFLQLVDFCAYSLLMLESKDFLCDKYNICDSFRSLDKICFKACNKKDPFGIMRK